MTKSRKKKNFKLRRRIQRTIAAVTMITAVVVAAIPVENLGTMQAAAAEKNIADIYESEMTGTSKRTEKPYELKQPADLEDKYTNGTDVRLQRIENGMLLDIFSAKLSGNDAMITEYISPANIPNLEIKEYECIGYVYWETGLPNSIHTEYASEEIEITFPETGNVSTYTSSETQNKNVTVPKKLSVSEQEIESKKIAPKASTNATVQIDGQYTARTTGKINSLDVFKECYKSLYENRIAAINAYNQEIDNINNTLGNSSTYTDAQITDAQNRVGNLDSNLNILKRALLQDESNDNDLTDVDKFIIRRAYSNGNNDLQKCNIVKINAQDTATGTVSSYYAPVLLENTADGKISGQYSDEQGYLASKSVKVSAISKFGGRQVGNVKISAPITFIAKEAFKGNEYISSVEINTNDCFIISDEAFKECNNLTSVSFTEGKALTKIGKEAFASSSLSGTVEIPNNVKDIGAGAFSGTNIETITFSGGNGNSPVKIGPYAYYNCANLKNVNFPDDTKYTIYQGAFAVGDSAGGTMEKFAFPVMNESMEQTDGDYILAGRNRLTEVTFAGYLNGKIPSETLMGCTGLQHVLFPDGAYGASYNPTSKTSTERGLFEDVQLPNFYVEGPGYAGNTTSSQGITAKVRETTWSARTGLGAKVPYKFTDENGEHFEFGDGEKTDGSAKYIATLDIIDGKAVLSSYFNNGNVSDNNIRVEIPPQCGDYIVTAIGNNCFKEEVKKKIAVLVIPDYSIERIEAGAFEDAKNLKWVEIGGAVEFIGKDAFKGCDNLENVVFSPNLAGTYDSIHVIEDDSAFATGSEFLTFHGAIDPDYGPYKLAMKDCRSLTGARQICYVTDAPLNLMVIRDNGSGKATLIDYPHYEEIDTINGYETNNSLLDRFEKIQYESAESDTISVLEGQIVDQTLNMGLPNGIESVNAKDYLSNADNAKEKHYFSLAYKAELDDEDKPINYNQDTNPKQRNINTGAQGAGTNDTKNVDALYSQYNDKHKETDKKTNKEIATVPGLFSGYFDESSIEASGTTTPTGGLIWRDYNDHSYTEKYNRGNDYLTSINMPTVVSLPDYAFDSCENLKVLGIGAALDEVGAQPFRDCKSLYQINTNDSKKYAYENMLFYENQGDDANPSYKLLQCLEGRGRRDAKDGTYGSKTISSATNPGLSKVSAIADYAFANCDEILDVNLEDAAGLKIIPVYAFSDCTMLTEVKLPKSVNRIDEHSFEGVADGGYNFKLEVPNPNCVISDKAFDFDRTGHVIISGIQYIDEASGEESTAYNSFLQLEKVYGDLIEFKPLGSTYTVRFYDEDYNQLGEDYEIDSGEDVLNPPTDAARAAAKTGRKFDQWLCLLENGDVLVGEAAYTNIKENRRIIAQYVDDPNSVVSDGKDYALTVENGKALINNTPISTFPTTLKGGTTVTVIANDETNFKVWTVNPGTYTSLLTSASMYMTSFTMPNSDITVTANSAVGSNPGGDTPNPDGTYTVTVNNGTGGGNYAVGATVTITANAAPTGQSFANWTTGATGVNFANANTATTTFVMPASNVTVTANYTGSNAPGGDTPGGNTATKYKLTVNYGTGSGEYASGETVTITANAPDSSNRVFSKWTTNSSGVTFASATSATTTIVMPASDAVVTANYKLKTSDDDDDDDSSGRRPGTNTNTTTVNNRPGSSTSTTGTTGTVSNGTNGNDDGNRIYITKNGISNKDVASVSVDGSTDNFIVKITESPEATAAVEQALTNQYGSLDGLAYFPMDISLYDSTGQNKITDTHGLNITVTMPIPDVLIQYGGNNRVAAADNGNLQQLTPKFTTIDGIACISFVPPHFSPYVIYVDTNNLIAGQTLDSTPSTGDPIHPKWFVAIGMACLSVVLFATSNGKKRRNYRAA